MNRLMGYPQINKQAVISKGAEKDEGAGLLSRLHWRATYQQDRIAYRFLADSALSTSALPLAHCDSTTWTYGELYRRVQTISGELSQQENLVGQPVLLVYPPGLELIAAFLGCLSAGAIATLVPPPRRHESLSRWQHIMADANVAGVLTTQSLSSDIEPLISTFLQERTGKEKPHSFYQLATDTIKPSDEPSKNSSHTLYGRSRLSPESESSEFPNLELSDSEFPKPDTIAFLQYTSGSTSQPKGVIVTHGNIAHNLQQIQVAFGHSADTRCVIWLPPYHDMGLIGGILQPLYGGYPVTLMSPTAFLQRPIRWLEAISHFAGTTSGGPNFAYDYCVQKISFEQCKSLDLSAWSVAFTGAEPIQAQTLRRFAEKFSSYGFQQKSFYPCYGLAEATLFVAGGNAASSPKVISVSQSALTQGHICEPSNDFAVQDTAQDVKEIVSCGRSYNQRATSQPADCKDIAIVDPQTKIICAPNQVGEVWVSGESVSTGYWNRVETTQATFNQTLESCSHTFLRTGDLGFLKAGELFITGRLKDLIVIRGQNYYPQDIELSASQADKSLQPASAAFGLSVEEIEAADLGKSEDQVGGQERLVIVQEVSRSAIRKIRKQALSGSKIVEAIRANVSRQHGLQVWAVVLIKPGHLPKTTSGKVKRQACKRQFKEKTLETVAQEESPFLAKDHSIKGTIEDAVANTDLASDKQKRLEKDQRQEEKKTQQLIGWLQDYAKASINSRLMDERRCLSPGVILDFGNQGLLGMQVPEQYGGLGLNNRSMLRVIEQLGAIDPTLALFVGLNNVLGIRPILNYAPHELKERLLPNLATGRELAAFALTESEAGSHPFGIRTQATPVEKAVGSRARVWQLQGEKIWSGSAAWAGVTTVFAQQVDESGSSVGISAFALRKGALGLKQGPEALTMGMRGMVQNKVLLEGVSVDESQRLGAEGKGMVVAQDAMMYGRLAIAAACVGGMKRCAQLMVRYSKQRNISTGRLLDNPVVGARLSWLTNAIAATESLVTLSAERLDQGLAVPPEIYAACKIAAPEFYWQAADHLVQCLGGRGYIETNLAPQILRDARVLRIFEGPTESLAMYLGSRVLNQPDSLRVFFEELFRSRPSVSEAGELLFEASRWILEYYTGENSPVLDELAARRQAQFVIGEIATKAILLVALKIENAPESTIEWAQHCFDKAVKQALEKQLDESASLFATLETIEGYQSGIGEVEQTLPGVDNSVDIFLKISEKEVAEKVLSGEQVPVSQGEPSSSLSSPLTQTAKREEAIRRWMKQWLAEQLKIDAGNISVHKAFADYGLDSVMAVELAQDLGEFFNLSEPLEVTLAWNFPTIQALANHLAIMLSQPEIENAANALASQKRNNSEEKAEVAPPLLSNLSEAEAAKALAAELATVRGH
ncbi:MAG: AMP-binding protein [Cyanobacteria bacterium J06621_11]